MWVYLIVIFTQASKIDKKKGADMNSPILKNRRINGYVMHTVYNEQVYYQNFLSDKPSDRGVRVRSSGNLLYVFTTARAKEHAYRARPTRGAITRFSAGSGRRMGRYLRECVADYRYMHTLTYPSDFPHDGRIVKYHLRRYLQEVGRLAKANGREREFSCFWFLEFQERGAPHFHIFTTEFIDFRWCRETWYHIVNSGDIHHLKAGTRVEALKGGRGGTVSYAKKYAAKQEQKEVPDGYHDCGRFWGIVGLKDRVSADTTFFTDKMRFSDCNRAKVALFSLIQEYIADGSLKLLASSYGFRLFSMSVSNGCDKVLQSEIKYCHAVTSKYEHEDAFYDYHSLDDIIYIDALTGKRLKGGELYEKAKNGEVYRRKTTQYELSRSDLKRITEGYSALLSTRKEKSASVFHEGFD